ncbi:DUF3489 domain-containing protein [Roseomonas sp. GCM10028921]
MAALRAALGRSGAARADRDPSAPRRPREGTKHQAVLSLLRQDEGATIAQVMDETGWAQHTVRGFLAGLKRKGHSVEVLERVRHRARQGGCQGQLQRVPDHPEGGSRGGSGLMAPSRRSLPSPTRPRHAVARHRVSTAE